ncbi:class I SAM-dependent methyltransferase [Puniceicoccaceae bacterium K14]|nr:class I SAM-dependent methyltransferase [Puniceicoccaceae bacterium K14]
MNTPHQQDHFSSIAENYAKGRISYPKELYELLVSLCNESELAWDCATGSGQAAKDLAKYFRSVIATDISESQLSKRQKNSTIEFRKAPAEASEIRSNSVDLVTVAQAIHWFDLEPFWNELQRVSKPNGVFAFWGYQWPQVSQSIDGLLNELKLRISSYWPQRSKALHNGYAGLHAPFQKIASPKITISEQWSLNSYFNHINSWSAVRYLLEDTGTDILDDCRGDFEKIWKNDTLRVSWPLILKIYRIP